MDEQHETIAQFSNSPTVSLSPNVSFHIGGVVFYQVTREQLELLLAKSSALDFGTALSMIGIFVASSGTLLSTCMSDPVRIIWTSVTFSSFGVAVWILGRWWLNRRNLAAILEGIVGSRTP